MRTGNLVIVAFGFGATGIAMWIAWRWRNLSVHASSPPGEKWRTHLIDATRTFAATTTAGAVSGLLVLGFGGRLVMRIVAASSGDDAQGRLTEAEERVGDITTDGTMAFLGFVGIGGGIMTALAYLLLRPILPDHAGRAGLIGAVLLTGTIGVDNPISPDNVDFALLTPLPLAIILLLATAVLFATTFTALAARFEEISAGTGTLPRRLASMLIFPLTLVPPFTLIVAAYVLARSALTGRSHRFGESPRMRVVASVLVGMGVVLAAINAADAIIEIL